jgi:hypothetical protein
LPDDNPCRHVRQGRIRRQMNDSDHDLELCPVLAGVEDGWRTRVARASQPNVHVVGNPTARTLGA